jgi:alpha-tubulin suppressor-like RCC1 family protein
MKRTISFFGLSHWLVVLAGLIWLGAATAAALQPEQPAITSIYVEQADVVVVVHVPPGIRKVTLESRTRLIGGAWEPRAVARLDGQGGKVIFRLARSEQLEVMRVRADTQEVLPSFFYRGATSFAGQPLSVPSVVPPSVPPTLFGPGDYYGWSFSTLSQDRLLDAGLNYTPTLVPAAGQEPVTREVVESDIWKLSGDALYFFNQYRGLQIIDVANPDAPVVRGTLSLPQAGEQMYLLGQSHVLLMVRNNCGDTGNNVENQVLIVNVAEAQPRVEASLPVQGQIKESRLVGTALYVATEVYRRNANSATGEWEWGTGIYSFDLAQPAAPALRDTLWFPGRNVIVAATDRYFFVALLEHRNIAWNGSSWYRAKSLIHLVDISAPNGAMKSSGYLEPFGEVKDKFKLNLNGDVLTVVSEERFSTLITRLETFSLAAPTAPQKLGSLDIVQGEQLYATRFDGNRAYIVTFRRIDPLWIVDLSNPAQPQIKGELQVPGWSTYIHPLGDRLVSIGIDDASGRRVAVSLFNVQDVSRPSLLSRIPLGENSSWSEANTDEKAFGILPEAGLLLVPFSSFSTNQQQGVQLIDLTRDALAKRGFIAHNVQARRATVHRDRILSISGRELLTVDASDRDKPLVRAATQLAWRVDRVIWHGEYLIELANKVNQQNGLPPLLHIVSAKTPDQVLDQFSLDDLAVLGATVQGERLYIAQGQSSQVQWRWNAPTGKWLNTTNPAMFTLSVYDLSQLPQLSLLGQTNVTFVEPYYWGDLEALWPKANVLVWSSSSTSGYWLWPGDPVYWLIDVPVTRPGDIWGGDWATVYIPQVDYVTPWLWQRRDRRLLAFEVTDPTAPRFCSKVDLAGNNWGNSSTAFAAEGNIYSSHQAYETQILGTNYYAVTNWTQLLVTNVVTITNVTWAPQISMVTNVHTKTNYLIEPYYTTVTNIETFTNYTYRVAIPWLEAAHNQGPISPAIAAGGYHNLGLKPEGTVWTWGGNWFGQLGDGATSNRNAPEMVLDLSEVCSVAAGQFHSLALKVDGSLWAWGMDSFGQLGDGSPAPNPDLPPLPPMDSTRPVLVVGLSDVRGVAAGEFHSLAVTADGLLWGWGDNWFGQLGDSAIAETDSPARVAGLTQVKRIAAGGNHSLAVTADGSLWAWGDNAFGQLGDGTTSIQTSPAQVQGLSNVRTAAGGYSHTLALKSDGTVWAWGRNHQGQLGDGTDLDRARPALVDGLSEIVAVTAGQAHSLALRADGTVWAWGANALGQLGDGTITQQNRPVAVPGISDGIAVVAGLNHSVALKADGQIWAWGDNQYGQLGSGTLTTFTNFLSLTNFNVLTNYTTITNFVTVTNIVTVTNFIPVTNISTVEKVERISIPVVTTNAVPIIKSFISHYLDVVDYTDPIWPSVRKPVNIPGQLHGVAYQGALLYTMGCHWTTNGVTDNTEWLDASAYDGVTAALVDSLALPKAQPRPLLVQGTHLFIGHPANSTNLLPSMETWTLDETGRFRRLAALSLKSAASSLRCFGALLAFQSGDGLFALYDATDPAQLRAIGAGELSGCLGSDLNCADGGLSHGLWLPLGDYGLGAIGRSP